MKKLFIILTIGSYLGFIIVISLNFLLERERFLRWSIKFPEGEKLFYKFISNKLEFVSTIFSRKFIFSSFPNSSCGTFFLSKEPGYSEDPNMTHLVLVEP
jgi:hypothetical protein